MFTKLKKGLQYIGVRLFECKISIKEFRRGSKLGNDTFRAFFENGMLVEVHSVEKGLGLKNTAPGHSSKPVINLLNKMFGYIGRGYDINSFAFRETFRVITAYVEYQKQFDTSGFAEFSVIERKYNALCEKLGSQFIENVTRELEAGSHIVTKEEMLKGKEFDFDDFVSTRHSIRMYDKKPLSYAEIRKAVELANKAPSACNRQPSYVYFSNQKFTVEKIDELITGSNGFKGETPNYIVITTDRACFMKEEQFQWYINGGIYLSYLVMALHSLGIGACIMQWKAFHKNENELKKLLGISKSEAIIAIVGCGYYQENTKCIYAQRKNAEDTLRIVGK